MPTLFSFFRDSLSPVPAVLRSQELKAVSLSMKTVRFLTAFFFLTSAFASADEYVDSEAFLVGKDTPNPWIVEGDLYVGYDRDGTLVIGPDGVVSNQDAILATTSGTRGVVEISGEWSNNGRLIIGAYGDGVVEATSGASISSAEGTIGNLPGASGIVTILGKGASWNNSGNLLVGAFSKGQLTIASGGKVENQIAYIGSSRGSTGKVSIAGAGSLWTNRGDLIIGSQGSGSLTIENEGVVTSATGYIGSFSSSSGDVTVSGENTKWENAFGLVVSSQGDGTLTVQRGGVVATGDNYLSFIAADADVTGTLNIGAPTATDPIAPGALDTPLLAFGEGDGRLIFNHTADDYLFTTDLTGNGSIRFLNGRTIFAGDASTFDGAVSVEGGETVVRGSIGAPVEVLNDARLSGDGTVGPTTLRGSATIAPGNSIGTLTVAGGLTFEAGSSYAVEVAPGGDASDRIAVDGIADLSGGTVQHVGLVGDYDPTSTYTILTADSLGGTRFAGVTSTYTFLDPSLIYRADAVDLRLDRNDISFASVGRTRNQIAAANGVGSLAFGDDVYDAVVQLDPGAARDAFDQLSGEVHASAAGAFVADARFMRDAAGDRIRSALAADGEGFGEGEALGAAGQPLGFGPGVPAIAIDEGGSLEAWSRAFGAWGETDGDGNAANLDRDTGGVFVGLDGALGAAARLGVFGGWSRTDLDVDAGRSSLESDDWHLGLYAGTQLGGVRLSGGAGYSWHDIETRRSIGFGAFTDALDGDTHAETGQVFAEAAYRVGLGAAALEPFAGLAYVHHRADGFAEDGGAAALDVSGQSMDTGITTLGLRASTMLGARLSLSGEAGWRHAFGDTTPERRAAFAASDAFTVAGVPLDEDVAFVEAGLDYAITDEAWIGISYQGEFGADTTDNGVRADLSWRF